MDSDPARPAAPPCPVQYPNQGCWSSCPLPPRTSPSRQAFSCCCPCSSTEHLLGLGQCKRAAAHQWGATRILANADKVCGCRGGRDVCVEEGKGGPSADGAEPCRLEHPATTLCIDISHRWPAGSESEGSPPGRSPQPAPEPRDRREMAARASTAQSFQSFPLVPGSSRTRRPRCRVRWRPGPAQLG